MGQWADNDDQAAGTWADSEALDVPLGDLMRGERATLGKSLLDVERDLKIKAAYIAAIENADVSAFTTKGFIAGYVRSYARYLGMDADDTFARFSAEAGFDGVHGTGVRPSTQRNLTHRPAGLPATDALAAARINLSPQSEGFFSRIEPGALGSALVLIALLGGIGYGAWAVLNDIQRVQFAPVESEPETMAQLDPITPQGAASFQIDTPDAPDTVMPQGGDAIDRLYRPQLLDVPVLTPRDQAIVTLDPDSPDTFGPFRGDETELAAADEEGGPSLAPDVQVTARAPDEVTLFAVSESWVRVRSSGGTILFETVMTPGQIYTLPITEDPATLRTGNAGGVFFLVNGVAMGPAGASGAITDGVALTAEAITSDYTIADLNAEPEVVQYVELILSGDATELNPAARDAAPAD